MSQLKAVLFRRDRAWLTAAVGALMLAMVASALFSRNVQLAFAASPTVTDANISITSSGTGNGGSLVYKRGDTIVTQWNNGEGGDNNIGILSVTIDFSDMGGGAAVAAEDDGAGGTCNDGLAADGVYCAAYSVNSGSSVEVSGVNVDVSATNVDGTTTVSDSTGLTVDTIAPTVVSGYYQDGVFAGVDGTVDSAHLVFDEDVIAVSCATASFDFSPNDFGTFQAMDIGLGACTDSVTDGEIDLLVDTTADQTGVSGGTEPSFSYDSGSGDITDLAGNEANSGGGISLDDGAGPYLIDAQTKDTNSDGLIDRIVTNWTEEVDSTGGDYSVTDYDVDFIDDNGAQQFVNISTDTPSSTGDTGIKPEFEVGAGNVVDTDANSNAVLLDVTPTDEAEPVICSNVDCDNDLAEFLDTDNDGNVDEVVMTWSENVFGDGGEGSFNGSEFDIHTSDTGLDPVDETSNDSGDVFPTNVITVDFSEASTFPTPLADGDTGDGWVVDIVGTVNDSVSLTGNDTTETTLDLYDAASPVIGNAFTQDTDYNGFLDRVVIDYSEDVSASANGGDYDVIGFSDFTAEGCGDCGANSYGIAVNFDENDFPDTGATPEVDQIGTVSDPTGNDLTDVTVIDTFDTANAVIVDSDPNDGGSMIPRDADVKLTFSEEMDTDTLDANGEDYAFSPSPEGVGTSFSLDSHGNTVMSVSHDAFDNNTAVDFTVFTTGVVTAHDLVGNYTCENDDANDCNQDADWTISFTARNSSGGGGGGGGGGTTSTTPIVDLTAPGTSTVWAGGTANAITWTKSGSGIDTFKLQYSLDGGGSWNLIADNISNATTSWSWTAPNVATSIAQVMITAQDSGKAILDTDSSGNFTITTTTTPPPNEIPPGVTIDGEGRRIAPGSGTFGSSPWNGQSEEISSVSAGWYVRSYNYNTVYRVEADGTRRPFWDATTFMTWADSWNDVIWVTDATLATMPLGDVMLPQPRAIMVKITSDPNVYWVEESVFGEPYLLLHVTSETLASELFGSNWADKIIDVEPTMFGHYEAGVDITTAELLDTSGLLTRDIIAARVAGL